MLPHPEGLIGMSSVGESPLSRSLAVITGASSGIGMAFARKLAASHNLLLVARREERLNELAAQITKDSGAVVTVLRADLTNEEDLSIVADKIAGESNLDLLINNAGFGTMGLFWEAGIKGQEQMHRLHVMATVRLTHAGLGKMVRSNSGGIINVASVSAFFRVSGNASYAATKSWITSFTEGLYLELKSVHSAVKVQALCPGFTYSEFHDLMHVDRESLAPSLFWLRAEDVVDESLRALQLGKLFVIPGWRYKAIVSLISKLPTSLRLSLEKAGPRKRRGSSQE
jgi:short-subunit dehydrogenase